MSIGANDTVSRFSSRFASSRVDQSKINFDDFNFSLDAKTPKKDDKKPTSFKDNYTPDNVSGTRFSDHNNKDSYYIGDDGSDTQKTVASHLCTILNAEEIHPLLTKMDSSGEEGISSHGLRHFATLDVNEKDAEKWGGITDKKERQAIQDAAKSLLGLDDSDPAVSKMFYAALASEGHSFTISLDETKKFVKDPSEIPDKVELNGPNKDEKKDKSVEDKMHEMVGFLLSDSNVMDLLMTDDGKVSDAALNKLADAKMDSDDWGNVPEDKRQKVQDTVRILLCRKKDKISDPEHRAIGDAFEEKFGAFRDIPLEDFKSVGNNTSYDGKIDPWDVRQMSEGNCAYLAGIAAFAQTPEGQKILQESIKDNGDGTWTVTFKGNPEKPILITKADLEKNYSSGDGDVEIINAALEKFKGSDNSSSFFEIWPILHGKVTETFGGSKDEIKDFLIKNADAVGDTMLLGFGGAVGDNDTVDISRTNHAFFVSKIDVENNEVTIRNPWDTSKEHKMSLTDFAEEFQKADKDLEYMTL